MAKIPTAAIGGRRVFVTGASGFIGHRLIDALLRAEASVTVLSRSGRFSAPDGGSVKIVTGDLGDAVLLNSALKDQDVVFNLAYDVRASAASNLAAFETLLQAAAGAGVGRIVHASSIVVYDAWPASDIDEKATMDRPGGSPYRQAKIEMERRLMQGTISAAILQPTIVYGPGSALWTDQMAEFMAAGGVVLPDPEGLCNGVFVDDVVQAMLRAAVLADLEQERFVISGAAPFSWSDLLNGYAAIIGKGAVQHKPLADLQGGLGPEPSDEGAGNDAPSAMARISAVGRRVLGHDRFEGLVRFAKRKLSKGGVTYPDHHLLGVFSATGTCKIDHARVRLGYAPEFDLPKGLAATKAHLKRLF